MPLFEKLFGLLRQHVTVAASTPNTPSRFIENLELRSLLCGTVADAPVAATTAIAPVGLHVAPLTTTVPLANMVGKYTGEGKSNIGNSPMTLTIKTESAKGAITGTLFIPKTHASIKLTGTLKGKTFALRFGTTTLKLNGKIGPKGGLTGTFSAKFPDLNAHGTFSVKKVVVKKKA